MEGHFEIQLLGPPQLRWRDRSLTLPRRQARALLFRLAAESQPVPREELADLLWSETPPATARRNLTRLLSYLRKQLPHPDLILTANSAVSLNHDIARSDAILFSELCRSDDPGDWQSAVSLYRGPFLSGFVLDQSREFDSWQSLAKRRFEERYLKVLRRLVLSRYGGPAQAIRYAGLYLAVDDLAEDIHKQLITLYAQTGDRAAALHQYEECLFVLERELGVKPLPETRAAYEAVRDGQLPTVPEKAPQPQWATLPSLDLPLTGREEAWQTVSGAYGRFSGGGVIFISGEAGVGKSRLMQEFATKSAALVLSGSSQSESSAVPYQPLIQALRQALSSPSRWTHILPIWLAELSRLMPELPDHFPGLPLPLDVEPQQAQARIFEALWQVFAGLAAASPLLLCLDDLHRADESTRGWLAYAAGRLSGSSLCILATFRAQHRALLQEMQRSLQRSGLTAEVVLEGLSQTAVASLLQQAHGKSTAAKALAERIHAATGGNTFFVLETIREQLETGRLDDPPADLPLPTTVREAVLRRAARLSPLAQQILEITTVLSPLLTFPAISETSGRDELQTADGLGELEAHQILLADRDRFVFHHALARDAIYQNISDWRRRLLHRRAADALVPYAAGDNEQLALIAAHFELAGDPLLAIDYYRQAAAAASALFAFQEAIQQLQHAISLVDDFPESPAIVSSLYEELAENLAGAGKFPNATETFQLAVDMAPDNDPLRMAALERKLAATLPPQQREDEAERHYRSALRHLEQLRSEGHGRPRQLLRLDILLELLEVFYLQIRPEAMAGLSAEIEALLDEIGSAARQSRYHSQLWHIAILQDRFHPTDKTFAMLQQALAFALESGNEKLIADTRFLHVFHFLWEGSHQVAVDQLLSIKEAAKQLGDAWLLNKCLAYLTVAHRLQVNAIEVAAGLPKLTEVSRLVGNRYYLGVAQANAAWLHYRSGKWRQARDEAESAVGNWAETHYPFQWLAYWILLAIALQEDRLADAVDAASAMLDHKQQKLPDEIDQVLTSAVATWEAGDEKKERDSLETAASLARQHGYL